MEIEKTFIVEYQSFPTDKRFVKVYLSKGRYFLQIKQGAIMEIDEDEFNKLCNATE